MCYNCSVRFVQLQHTFQSALLVWSVALVRARRTFRLSIQVCRLGARWWSSWFHGLTLSEPTRRPRRHKSEIALPRLLTSARLLCRVSAPRDCGPAFPPTTDAYGRSNVKIQLPICRANLPSEVSRPLWQALHEPTSISFSAPLLIALPERATDVLLRGRVTKT